MHGAIRQPGLQRPPQLATCPQPAALTFKASPLSTAREAHSVVVPAASKGGANATGQSAYVLKQEHEALKDRVQSREFKGSAAGQLSRQRLKLTVAYDGSNFSGFQLQGPKTRTVQAELEKAAQKVFVGCSRMVGASRTDAGAHAYGQVAHFDILGSRDNLETDTMFVNNLLPSDVKILGMQYAPRGFDSLSSSVGKTYSYQYMCGLPDPLQANRAWWPHKRHVDRTRGPPLTPAALHLDVPTMQQAAKLLLGTHDFTALADTHRPAGRGAVMRKRPNLVKTGGVLPERNSAKNTRTLGEVRVVESWCEHTHAQKVTLWVTGDGFLYHMVRCIAAALLEVGAGRLTADKLGKAISKGDREALPEAAPPHGLCLTHVWYEDSMSTMLDRCDQADGRQALEAAVSQNQKQGKHNEEQEGSGVEEQGQEEAVM